MAQQRRTSATQGRTSATRGQTGATRKVTQTRRQTVTRSTAGSAQTVRRTATQRPSQQRAAQGQRQRTTAQGQRSRTASAQRRSVNGQRQSMPVQKSREELRREARLKRERQQRRKRRFTTCMLALAAIVIGVVLSLTVFFKISTIEVTGTSQYSKETILNVCGVDTGDNLFLVKKARVADKIGRALPFTGEITVKRSFPNKIVIQVTDSVPSAAVAYEDGYALLNQDQKVLATVSTEEELYTLVAQQLRIAEEATAAEESQTENNAEDSTGNGADDSTATASVTTAAAQGNSTSSVASASSSNTSSGTTKASSTKSSSTKSSTSASGTASGKTSASAGTGKSTGTASQTKTEEETTTASDADTQDANADTSVSVTEEEIEAAKSRITMISGLTVSKAEAGKKITFESNAAYTAYQDVAKALEEEEFTGVTGLDFTNSSDVRMEYEKRIILKLGSASGLNRKLQLAEKVLEEQNAVSTELTGTIDLTISGRAYFSDEAESLTTTKTEEETSAVSETSETSESSTTSGKKATVSQK